MTTEDVELTLGKSMGRAFADALLGRGETYPLPVVIVIDAVVIAVLILTELVIRWLLIQFLQRAESHWLSSSVDYAIEVTVAILIFQAVLLAGLEALKRVAIAGVQTWRDTVAYMRKGGKGDDE